MGKQDLNAGPAPTPAAAPAEDSLERKSTRLQEPAGDVVSIDETEGLVTAIVSVTGIEDHVKDTIRPGSYADTLARRRPKVVQHHDWKQPVARVEDVKELPPGDPELPKETPDGKPWPKEAGALRATMRFNLKTQAGRDAFETVRFYSDTNEAEWSIGYKVPTGKATRAKDGSRQIKAIDLYEISFVLFGAAPGTSTLAVKDALTEAPPSVAPAGGGEAATDAPPVAAEPPAAAPSPTPGGGRTSPEDTAPQEPGPQTAEHLSGDAPAQAPAQAPAAGGAEGPEAAADELPDDSFDWESLDRLADALSTIEEIFGLDDAGFLDGLEDDEPDEDGEQDDEQDDDGEQDGDEQDGDGKGPLPAAGPEQQNHPEDGAADGGSADDAKTLAAQPVFDADVKRAFSPSARRKLAKGGTALPDGSYPIETVGDLRNAIKAFGRAKNPSRVKAHIIRRAKALGRTDLLPDGWTSGKTAGTKGTAAVEGKGSSASLNRSPRKNWVEMSGELPPYVREIARSIHEKRGIPLSQAIPMAISRIKRWARGGDNVKADTRAKAIKALAQWNALKSKNAARRGKAAPEAGAAAEADVVESTSYPYLPGTFEEIRAGLMKALTGHARPGRDGSPLVTIDATWADRAVATWFPPGEPGEARSYEVPYRFDGEGKVWLGEPSEVQLTADGDRLDSAPFPHPGLVEELTEELKVYLLHEGKAGRVLSTANANHLRGAVEQLVAVLRTAGIEILQRDKDLDEAADQAEPPVPDSTAPSAQPDGKQMVTVDPMLRAKALRAFAAARE